MNLFSHLKCLEIGCFLHETGRTRQSDVEHRNIRPLPVVEYCSRGALTRSLMKQSNVK